MGRCSSCGAKTEYPDKGLCVKCYRTYQKMKKLVSAACGPDEAPVVKSRSPWYCVECHKLMIPIKDDHCKCPKCGIEVWYEYDAPKIFTDTEYVSATRKPWICEDCRETMTMYRDFCKCQKCKTEVWFEWNAPKIKATDTVKYVSRSLPEGYRVPPGGSKSGKRSKKKGTKIYVDDVGFGG